MGKKFEWRRNRSILQEDWSWTFQLKARWRMKVLFNLRKFLAVCIWFAYGILIVPNIELRRYNLRTTFKFIFLSIDGPCVVGAIDTHIYVYLHNPEVGFPYSTWKKKINPERTWSKFTSKIWLFRYSMNVLLCPFVQWLICFFGSIFPFFSFLLLENTIITSTLGYICQNINCVSYWKKKRFLFNDEWSSLLSIDC